ncbi:hypothetical protein FOL47_001580, partial [Perkinsus chesapeaki]
MASGDYGTIISRYEDFCDEFINLAEQLLDDDDLSEKAYRKEIVGYFLHGLDPPVTRRIERDYEPEELEDHPTYSCPLTVAPGLASGERCDKCGLYHPTAEERLRYVGKLAIWLEYVQQSLLAHFLKRRGIKNAKNGRKPYDAARATPDDKVVDKEVPTANKFAGMAVMKMDPTSQESDTLDVAALKKEEYREPLHCSTIDTVKSDENSTNNDGETVVPLRLIPDDDAVDGRPTTCYVRDKRTFERLNEKEIKQCLE